MTITISQQRNRIDKLFETSSLYAFRLIRIAEILRRHRTKGGFNLLELIEYEHQSIELGDEVSNEFFGYLPTSKQINRRKLFEANALPPTLLAQLGAINKKGKGFVEAYIYKALEVRLSFVRGVENYIKSSTAYVFSIRKLVALFQTTPGLRRSIDKMYEILVYALIATIIRALKAQITLETGNKDAKILKDFERFIKMVLGIDSKQTKLFLPAALYRAGVANVSYRGLDMWSNFGAAIQVKHLTLTPELVEDIAEDIMAERIVIVCLDSEKDSIAALLRQVGWANRIQGIVSINDLDDWYKLCLSKKYRNKLGGSLLEDLEREFNAEFPSSAEIKPFMKERGYDSLSMPEGWKLK